MKDFSLLEREETAHNLEHADEANVLGFSTANHTHGKDEFSPSVAQLNQESVKSLDIENSFSGSSPIELNEDSNSSVKQLEVLEKGSENEFQKKETKRRFAMETGTTCIKNDVYLDLNLSPPRVYSRDKSSNESKSSSPTSQHSCVSSNVESNNLPIGSSPLIVMGCTRCLLYVMVPDADPKCPKCNNSGLLDIFRGNQTKRSRKN